MRARPWQVVPAALLVVVVAASGARPSPQERPPQDPPAQEPPAPQPSPLPSARTDAAEVPAPASPAIHFFAFGDAGTGQPDQYRVAAAVHRQCQSRGCDFGLLLGDNFYPDGVASADDPQWGSKFERPYADLLAAGIAFYPVLGNHDYADGGDLSLGAHQVAYAAGHPLWRMSAAHYTFDAGDATFVALDTQRIVGNDHAAVDAQRGMIAAALDGQTRPWIIAFGHHPHLSNGTNGNAGRLLAGFLEERLCGKADLYLAGHDHNLQVLDAPPRGSCRWLSVVAGGGGYESYRVGGANPSLFQSQTLGFAYVTVEARRLVVQLYDADGALLFTKELTK